MRTTAEIVLGVGDGLAFKRALDERSGYKELFIEEQAAGHDGQGNGHG